MHHCTSLEELGFKCNPASTKSRYRAIIFKMLPNLLKLDGLSLSERDQSTVDRDQMEMSHEMIQNYVKA